MRLATLRTSARDGQLVVIAPDGLSYAQAPAPYPTLQSALEDWGRASTVLMQLASALADKTAASLPLDLATLHSPLPRAYEWVDGSAYINHIILVRKARGAEPPATLETDPLVYQGGSSVFLGPREDIRLANPVWGLDFESEVAVVLGDVPQGTQAADAGQYIKLVMLVNDITLRNLVPDELAKSFGFFQSKPASAFSPFAVTPDELGDAWKEGRLHLPLCTRYNGEIVGQPNAGPEMHFSFHELIAHIAKTRSFAAGTILGSGTVSNRDRAAGISCLAERRMIETIETGSAKTPFMKAGDTVEIWMQDPSGRSIFGSIAQRVTAA